MNISAIHLVNNSLLKGSIIKDNPKKCASICQSQTRLGIRLILLFVT